MFIKVVAPILFLLSVVNANVDIVLHHRVYHPSFPNLKYLRRGMISGDPPTLLAEDSLAHDMKTFSKALLELGDPPDVFYQVSMTVDRPESSATLDYSSVKACHLSQANEERLILHVANDGVPFALDYFTSPVPNKGSCPKANNLSSSQVLQALANDFQSFNTTIIVKRPTTPPQPELRAPPPLNPEGEAVQAPPPKNFVQKYWLYIVGFLLVIMVANPEDPEQPRNSGGGEQ